MATSTSEYSEETLKDVWQLERPEDELLIAPALKKLYDKTTSQEYLEDWTSVIYTTARSVRISKQYPAAPDETPENIESAASDLHFFDLCLDNGLIQALLKLMLLKSETAERVKPWVAQAWFQVFTLADEYEKIVKIHEDLVHLCKDAVLQLFNSEIASLRLYTPGIVLLWVDCSWIRGLSNGGVAELCKACLDYVHAGDQDLLKEIRSNELSEYFEIIMQRLPTKLDPSEIPLDEAEAKLPFLWSQSQETAIMAVVRLIASRDLYTQKRDTLKIVQLYPRIFDQLLIIIGHFERPHYRPQSDADGCALKLLCLLLKAPYSWVTELSYEAFYGDPQWILPMADGGKEDLKAEWEASVKLLKMFIQQRNWKAIFLRKWNKLEQEIFEETVSKLKRTESEALLIVGTLKELLLHAHIVRGSCRSAILRILIDLTYGSSLEEAFLPTNLLLAFLPLAYSASQKVPSEERSRDPEKLPKDILGDPRDYLRQERMTGVVSSFPSGGEIASIWGAPEYTLGPVLLFRLIRRIFQTYGSDMFSWTSLPPNTLPKDQLGQIQQILSHSVLQLILRNTVTKRIPISKDSATSEFKKKQFEDSEDNLRGLYLAAAELALQVNQLYQELGREEDWKEFFLATQKDFVVSLSNASLMCRRLKDWYYSWWFSKATIEVAKKISAGPDAKVIGWDPQALLQKNQDRLLDAEKRLMEIWQGE
ncbi:hypothetical protein M422DRAFT_255696 [Sphaerobolus stellatus SS14]|uniref:Uncharacterized protein n=1 Tax=Sphaerobolus stellatus (strain SS14) TaxID=990650 RepID=A0A0C9VI96_SPHS4|nr:hypothetical protein M422DRAFT_255696 [Sphaerobolus stellatus SS14]